VKQGALASRLLGNASVYGFGLFVTRFGFFLLLPFVWQKLDAEDLGKISVSQMAANFLGPVMTLNLYDAIQRSYFEWNERDRRENLWTLWIVSVVFGIGFVSAFDWVGSDLWPLVVSQVTYGPPVRIILWTALFNNLTMIPMAVYRVQEKTRLYALVSIGSFCTMALLVMVLLYVFNWGVIGYLTGMLINAIVWCLIQSALLIREIRPRFRSECIRPALAYCLPTVPAGIMDSCGSVFDRFFLDKHVPLAAIGRYAVAFQWTSVLYTINRALKISWIPLTFRIVCERPDGREQLGRLGTLYVGVFSVFVLAVAILSSDLIDLIAPAELRQAATFVPWFALGFFLHGLTTGLGRGLDIAKRNDLTLAIACVGLIINFVTMAWLVPSYGVQGALAAYLLTTLVRTVLQIALAMRVYPRPLHWANLLCVLLIFAAGFCLGPMIATDHVALNLLLKSALVAACAFGVAVLLAGFKKPIRVAREVLMGMRLSPKIVASQGAKR